MGTVSFPSGQLWVHAKVPVSSITERIKKEVPKDLASAKDEDVGAPGRATYKVTRGEPKITISGDKLHVQVPVSADISVCKPIGKMCIGYGSCRPSFMTDFAVSTKLGDKYQLAPPRGTIVATKKCVIGIDVTSQIEKIARQEVRKVESRIASQWPKLLSEVEAGLAELTHPVPLAPDRCFFVEPEGVFYEAPTLVKEGSAETLAVAVGVTGKLLPASSCGEKRAAPPVVAPRIHSAPDEPSRIWLPEVVPWKDVVLALTTSASGAWAGEGSSVEVLDVIPDEKGAHLHVRTSGPLCGSFWVTGEWSKAASDDGVRLKNLALATTQSTKGKNLDRERTAALLTHLEKSARLDVAANPFLAEGAEVGLSNFLRVLLEDEVEFSISPPQAEASEVHGATEGLVVASPVTAQIAVTDL